MAGRSPSAGDLDQLARFLVGTPSGVLEASEVRAARERLGRMLVWNAQRLLGPDAREPAGRAVDAALSVDADPQPAWSDPSLGSAEWVRTDEGRLRKLQPGAGPDHTMAGRQEVAWALAGCELEWALDLPGRDRLISAFARHGGSPPTREVLHMHRLAAAALQAGMCRLCLDDETEPAERSRIEATGAARLSWLSALLGLS